MIYQKDRLSLRLLKYFGTLKEKLNFWQPIDTISIWKPFKIIFLKSIQKIKICLQSKK